MNDNEITPGAVVSVFWRWFWVAIGGLAVLTAVISLLYFTVWHESWWFSNQNANRQAHQIRNGYSNQQSLRDQITAQIGNVTQATTQIAFATDAQQTAALKAQRAAIAGIACQDIAEVTGDPLPAQQQQWAAANCQAGSVRPGSPYYEAGTP